MKPETKDYERYRVTKGPLASKPESGRNGCFLLPGPHKRERLFAVVSDQMGWEHVSVSPMREKRCPTWEEMCYIKDMFWDKDEVVIQYHPAESNYVNMHPFTLHLWKPVGLAVPIPPELFV